MVLPTTDALTPCILGKCSPETRNKWKERYRFAKKYGIRASFTTISGAGLLSLAKEAATDGVKRQAKRYIGSILVNSGLTAVSAGLPLLTNASKVVHHSKATHSLCAASWRAAHNLAEVPFIMADFVIFGEPVPSCGEHDYDLYNKNTSDVLAQFCQLTED